MERRRSNRSFSWRYPVMSGTLLLFTATPALAYIGPGGGLSALGAVLALVAAMVLALVGFVWFPIKRMRVARQKARQERADTRDHSGAAG